MINVNAIRGRTRYPGQIDLNVNPMYILDYLPVATCAYGFRKMTGSYDGYCVRLRRSDGDIKDFGFDFENLDTDAVSSWASGSALTIQTMYDISGNGYDMSQNTLANQPDFIMSNTGSKPAMFFDGDDLLTSSVAIEFASASPYSQMYVGYEYGATNYLLCFGGPATTYGAAMMFNADGVIYEAGEGGAISWNSGSKASIPTIMSSQRNPSNQVIQYYNTTSNNSGTLATGISIFAIGGKYASSWVYCTGYISECVLFSAYLSSDQMTILRNNMNQRYNIY